MQFWALFEETGSGGYAGNAWIRGGTAIGASFAWDTAQIPVPDPLWNYLPDNAYAGYLFVDRVDPDFIWVASCTGNDPDLRTKCWTYQISTNTWSLLLDVPFVGPSTPQICDMAQDGLDATMFLAIGGNGMRGIAGGVTEGGVYRSVGRAAFTFQGTGRFYGYISGNVNNPQSVTSLDIAGAGEGTRHIITSHSPTAPSTASPARWTSVSLDDGVNWDDGTGGPGNRFMLEAFTVFRWNVGGPLGDYWYASDHSATGPYALANNTSEWPSTDGLNSWGSVQGAVFSSGAICYPFPFDVNKGVAFPTQRGDLYHTVNGSVSWLATTRNPTTGDAPFNYRGGRADRSSLNAAGVSLADGNNDSELWWTEDGGATWNTAVAETNAHGLSLDFGPTAPPLPTLVWPQTYAWADSRGFVGYTRCYVGGTTQEEARTNAITIASLLEVMTTAHFLGANGAWTSSPVLPIAGADEQYNNIETRARFLFAAENGSLVAVEVPCPAYQIFLSDQENLDILNPGVAAAISGMPAALLSNRGGRQASAFIGGGRTISRRRQLQTIRTLNPQQTGPSGG